MNRGTLKLLFFIAFLLGTKSIFCMEEEDLGDPDHYHTSWGKYNPHASEALNINEEEADECPTCYISPVHYLRLGCGHDICTECIDGLLTSSYNDRNQMQLRCPNTECKKRFTDEDYTRMENSSGQLNANAVRNVKLMISEKATKIEGDFRTKVWAYINTKQCPSCNRIIQKNEGCKHMTCKCSHEFCWSCMGIWNTNGRNGYQYHSGCEGIQAMKATAKITAGSALAGYGIYRLYKTQACKNSLSWLSKKLSSIKQKLKPTIEKVTSHVENKSHLLITALVGAGIYTVLHKKSVNLAAPINIYLANNHAGPYWNITNMCDNNKFLNAIKNQFDKGNLINTSLSIAGGLVTGYGYKLLAGQDSNRKKPRPRIIPQVTSKK